MINQNWVFGNGTGLKFTNGTINEFSVRIPQIPPNSNFDARENCASISDDNGDLLFYTDGNKVWDATYSPIFTNIQGYKSASQGVIIVKKPKSSHEYYILTIGGSSGGSPIFTGGLTTPRHFSAVLVDTSTWTFSNISIVNLPTNDRLSPAERIVVVQHENCEDFWVITVLQQDDDNADTSSHYQDQQWLGQGKFRIYKININGISWEHDIDIPKDKPIHERGCMKVSPNGKLLALANGAKHKVFTFPFDINNGNIDITSINTYDTSTTSEPGDGDIYGLEFSPNSQYLYFATLGNGSQKPKIYRTDFININPSYLYSYPFPKTFSYGTIGALQLAIDGNIYFAVYDKDQLGVIENPNSNNPTFSYLNLTNNNNKSYFGLPNIIPNLCNPCDCDCDCSCCNCNEDAEEQNKELIEKAEEKDITLKSDDECLEPFQKECTHQVVEKPSELEPCFYYHIDESNNKCVQKIYITVCNKFTDIQYNGLQITRITLIPVDVTSKDIYIIPDRFICLDCLEPCSCQTREFALVNEIQKDVQYKLKVEYCYENIVITSVKKSGVAEFEVKK